MSAVLPAEEAPDAAAAGAEPHLHRSLDLADLRAPAVRAMARELTSFVRRLALRGEAVAVNGVPHLRWYVRRFKMWEYARGFAWSAPRAARRILDFGGGATLPAYWLGAQGKTVRVLDIDAALVARSNAAARRRGWDLEAAATDVSREALPAGWGDFDRVYSFCVLEHLPPAAGRAAFHRLAGALRPGGQLVASFEYGPEAPGEGALRDEAAVAALVESSGLRWRGRPGFVDTGQRFRIDRRHPERRFTFGLAYLEKP